MKNLAIWSVIFAALWPGEAFATPLVAAIGTVFTGIMASTVGSALVRIGLGVALSLLTQARAKKQQKQKFPGLTSEYTYGESTPLTVVWGRTALFGGALCPDYSDQLGEGGLPNRYLFRPTILSDRRITEIEGCYLDGKFITFAEGTSPRKGRVAITEPFAVKLWMNADLGTQTVANPIMRQNFGNDAARPWTAGMIGWGKAIVYPVFKMDKEDSPFQNVSPQPLWVVKGEPLYDPRTGVVAYTENPVLMIWHIMRGVEFPGIGMWGLGVDEADLPAAYWHTAMSVCDEMIDGSPRYRAGVEFGINQEPFDIIDQLRIACGGQISDCGGR